VRQFSNESHIIHPSTPLSPQQTMDFKVSQMTSKRKAMVLQDIPQEDADPMLPIRDLFTFSPFGLCCRQCKKNQLFSLMSDASPGI